MDVGFHDHADLIADATERIDFRFARSHSLGWILKTPMVTPHLSGENGTRFSSVVAHRDDRLDFHLEIGFEVFGVVGRKINADFSHHFYRQRVDVACGFGSGTVDIKQVSGGMAQRAFSHMAAAGVAGAKNEDVGFQGSSRHHLFFHSPSAS